MFNNQKTSIIALIFLALVSVFVFSEGLFTDKPIVSHDNKPVIDTIFHNSMENGRLNHGWSTQHLMGHPRVFPFSLDYFFMELFPPVFFLKFSYFFSITIMGIFFFLWLRSLKLSPLAALFGATGLMLSNSILTLINPGHLGKILALAWIPLVFLFLRRAVLEEKWHLYPISGFFLGLSFLGRGYQMSIFFALLAAFYFAFLILRQRAGKDTLREHISKRLPQIGKHVLAFTALVLITVMISMAVLPHIAGMTEQRLGERQVRTGEDENWEWATQWSLPPEEMLDFVLPGLFGWKSGNQEKPYWGRMGQSADGGRSLPNLKLNSENLGMLAFIFAIFAIFIYAGRQEQSEKRFWLWAAVIALLLALGKYIHLPYYLFSRLPMMDSIRNPNKFIKIIAFAVATLSAFGFEYLFFRTRDKSLPFREKNSEAFLKFLKYMLFVLGGLFLLSFFARGILGNSAIQTMIQRARGNSSGVHNVLDSYPAIFGLGLALALAAYYSFKSIIHDKLKDRQTIILLAAILIGLLGFELWLSGRHFVEFDPKQKQLYQQDPVTEYVKNLPGNKRTLILAQQGGLANHFGTYRFPLEGLTAITPQQILQASGRYQYLRPLLIKNRSLNREKFSSFCSVLGCGYIMALQNPAPTVLSNIRRFRLSQEAFLNIYRHKAAGKQAFLATDYRLFKGPKAIQQYLLSTNSNLYEQVCLEGDFFNSREQLKQLRAVKKARTAPSNAAPGRLRITDYGNNRITLAADSERPAILVLQDAFHPAWEARVNGDTQEIFPVNILSRGILLPAGTSEVIFSYEPDTTTDIVSLIGIIIGLLFLLGDGICTWRQKKSMMPAAAPDEPGTEK